MSTARLEILATLYARTFEASAKPFEGSSLDKVARRIDCCREFAEAATAFVVKQAIELEAQGGAKDA